MNAPDIIVAGHICLDIIPQIDASAAPNTLLAPGGLAEVGPAVTSAGGAVSNTGIALHRLGIPVRLMGKIGDDVLGRALLDVLRRHDGLSTERMLVLGGESTSYTIVVNPPGVDRSFLHYTGANSTFSAGDVPGLEGASFFHFGYPPLMERMFLGEGAEMAALFERVRSEGIFTSLDMAKPDPSSIAGRIDWRAWMRRVLPHVDLFGPSLDEICVMLGREEADYSAVADELIDMGTAIVAMKLGDQGLYLRTTRDRNRVPPSLSDEWVGRELLAPCFEVEAAGTTGAGDVTLAGLLAGLYFRVSPEEAVVLATAAGACSVEQRDSTSGVPRLDDLRRRIGSGWPRRPMIRSLSGWILNEDHGIWCGPADGQ